ncbi:MAG: HepT-like ribonuclease domain-containing protein [Microcoleaceae cyanobacterium]
MRNVLSHNYFEIDLDIVWSAVSVNIPMLQPQIEALLNRL